MLGLAALLEVFSLESCSRVVFLCCAVPRQLASRQIVFLTQFYPWLAAWQEQSRKTRQRLEKHDTRLSPSVTYLTRCPLLLIHRTEYTSNTTLTSFFAFWTDCVWTEKDIHIAFRIAFGFRFFKVHSRRSRLTHSLQKFITPWHFIWSIWVHDNNINAMRTVAEWTEACSTATLLLLWIPKCLVST